MPTKYEMQNGDCCLAFAASYQLSNLPAMLEIERSVLGCDYGGTSWTTTAQAEQIVDRLELDSGVHVLDIGAGSGWPGLFLADSSGCDVTLLDLPVSALAMARQRAESDGTAGRVSAIAASGSALPFDDASFPAISHSDVLCCLPDKIEMLDECRRVANDGARMVFSVIAVAEGLPEADRQRAIAAGPPFVEAPGSYPDMLANSGWRQRDCTDCTKAYRRSLSTLVKALGNSAELLAELGDEALNGACEHRLEQIALIDAGLLVREVYFVTTH